MYGSLETKRNLDLNMDLDLATDARISRDLSNEDVSAQMIRTLEEVRELAKAMGVDVIAYSDCSLGQFKSLPTPIQLGHLKSAKIWRDSYVDAVAAAKNVVQIEAADRLALRAAATKFGFIIDEDFYSYIRKGDVIEIYTFHGMNQCPWPLRGHRLKRKLASIS